MNKIKNYILAGLLVWLPIGLTVWVVKFVINFIDQIIPNMPGKIFGLYVPLANIIIGIFVLFITGMITKNFLGQKLVDLSDQIISHIPIIKSIYRGIKQVSDTLLSRKGAAFSKPILVKFPHNESWTIAFITGTPNHKLMKLTDDQEYVNVYVPTTPNPTSGYFIIVNKKDTKELDMSVDEALKYVISMGVVEPKISKN